MSIYIDFAQGFNLPPYWLNHPQVVKRFDENSFPDFNQAGTEAAMKQYADTLLDVPHACPLKIGTDENEKTWWQLPIEPVISISGKNIITRRNVMKQGNTERSRGTIKETWSQDDYEITIAGILVDKNGVALPEDDLRKLRTLCELRNEVFVSSPLFTIFNIRRIAIESFELPFTKGIENQMFTIKGYSDELFDLVVKETQK